MQKGGRAFIKIQEWILQCCKLLIDDMDRDKKLSKACIDASKGSVEQMKREIPDGNNYQV